MKAYSLADNQTVFAFDEWGEIFFSYQTPVCIKLGTDYYVNKDKCHTVTTRKYLYKYTGIDKKEFEKKVQMITDQDFKKLGDEIGKLTRAFIRYITPPQK